MNDNMRPQVPKKVVVVGGGTAGWMTAILLKNSWAETEVQVIESPEIPIIGVGEGSTPALKYFFKLLGIEDEEWMAHCNATYKVGIEFPGWSTIKGHESYFHPFFSALDSQTSSAFVKQVGKWRMGEHVNVLPDNYFVASALAKHNKSIKTERPLPVELDYGYHFDSVLLGDFLRFKSVESGVLHDVKTITSVKSTNGNIISLHTDDGEVVTADLFIDCTGFAGVLVNKALKRSFHSYKSELFNDAAVAIQTPKLDEHLSSKTTSIAMSNGWRWHIPLRSRDGNGYVYSSEHITRDEAEAELRLALGDIAEGCKAKHLDMKVGRLKQHLAGNCLAVGLSQGFIEPLEATALMLVQYTVTSYIGHVHQESTQKDFNDKISAQFDGIKDYVVCHYKVNSLDGLYWQQCRDNEAISAKLKAILSAWRSEMDLEAKTKQLFEHSSYAKASWYSILCGMGVHTTAQKNTDFGIDPLTEKAKLYCEETAALFIEQSALFAR